MSTQLERRIAKLERQNAPEFGPDEVDPALVKFFQELGNGYFKDFTVPSGISAEEFVGNLLDSLSGNVLGVTVMEHG